MVSANLTCLPFRLPSPFSASSLARMSRLLSGVRSSCDMLARNSDLYFDDRASCSARSSSSRRARWHVEEDRLLLEGGLPDHALPRPPRGRQPVAPASIAEAGDESEKRVVG